MYKVDERGSKDQRTLYDYMTALYPKYEIIYEFPLYDIGQRIDIFVPVLGIALEYDGRQHTHFIEHFHKNAEGWKKAFNLDSQKTKYLMEKGVKLVRIPFDEMVENKEELKQIIDSIPFPDTEYSGFETSSPKKKKELDEAADRRKQLYQDRKQQLKRKLD